MSNHYATIISNVKDGFPDESRNLCVNAFMGELNEEYGSRSWIQLTTDKDYITLSPKQIRDLINILQARLDNKVTSTGCEDMGEFYPTDKEQNISTNTIYCEECGKKFWERKNNA